MSGQKQKEIPYAYFGGGAVQQVFASAVDNIEKFRVIVVVHHHVLFFQKLRSNRNIRQFIVIEYDFHFVPLVINVKDTSAKIPSEFFFYNVFIISLFEIKRNRYIKKFFYYNKFMSK